MDYHRSKLPLIKVLSNYLAKPLTKKKATQAVKLANRISGVVTVEDDISRTLDIQDNVTPVVNDLVNQSKAGLKALPLLLVALLAFALVAWLGGWLSRREKTLATHYAKSFYCRTFGPNS